jgi:hypothetical protein
MRRAQRAATRPAVHVEQLEAERHDEVPPARGGAGAIQVY